MSTHWQSISCLYVSQQPTVIPCSPKFAHSYLFSIPYKVNNTKSTSSRLITSLRYYKKGTENITMISKPVIHRVRVRSNYAYNCWLQKHAHSFIPSSHSESSRQKLALCPSATLVPLLLSRS